MAETPCRRSACTDSRTSSSFSGTRTRPFASSRSRMPRRRRRGARKVGVSGSIARSYMRERFIRPSSSTSSKPAVVRTAVTAPFCSRIALVATVVPCMKRSTSPAGAPAMTRTLRTAAPIPSSRSFGVLGTFVRASWPPRSSATMSVKVPPMSTPICTLSSWARSRYHSRTRPSGEVTGDPATVELAERRLLGSADILGERAARAKAAAARHRARVRRLTLQGEVERDAAAADAGHRGQQRLRVGMAGLLEDRRLVAVLDDLAEVHHRDPRAHRADHGEVVRDEHVGEREGLLKTPEELQHARLNGDVEPRGRLVEDHQTGMQCQDAGQPYPALLTAAQLVRIEVEVRIGEPDCRENCSDLPCTLGTRKLCVDLQRLVQRVDDLPPRVQRGSRILVHVLEIPGDPAALTRRQAADLAAGEPDVARCRRLDADRGLAERRLSTTALPDEAERLPRLHGERHAVDGP